MSARLGPPARDETAAYYHRYIDRVPVDDIVAELEQQLERLLSLTARVTEKQSLNRYAPDKWSIRQVLGHINDCERLFTFRAFWFARGFDSELPSFDPDVCTRNADSDEISWTQHVDEFRGLRQATIAFFKHLPAEAWMRRGIASGNPFTVRALAYLAVGHAAHHLAILEDQYGLKAR